MNGVPLTYWFGFITSRYVYGRYKTHTHTHTTHVRCSSFCLSLIFASYSLFVRFDWFLFRVFLALLVVFVVFLRMNISFSVHNSTVRLHSRFAFFRLRLLKYIVSRTMPAVRSFFFFLSLYSSHKFLHSSLQRPCVCRRAQWAFFISLFFLWYSLNAGNLVHL